MMSSSGGDDEGLLLGYTPKELELGEERKRNLSSVILKLSQEWDLNPESPERSRPRSITSRRGSLDLPKNGGKSLRSRSCDMTAEVDKIKSSLKLDDDFASNENLAPASTKSEAGEETTSFELETAMGDNQQHAAVNSQNHNTDDEDQEAKDVRDDLDIDKVNNDERIGSQEDGISESLKETDSEETATEEKVEESKHDDEHNLSDDEILEKVLELVPQEELDEQAAGDIDSARETRRTRASTTSNESSTASCSEDSGNFARETRTRGGGQHKDEVEASSSATPVRETRTRSNRELLGSESSSRERRSRSSLAAAQQLQEDDDKAVRETRARSRAAAEENQPPARSLRSNRDATPESRRGGSDRKRRLESSTSKAKRGSGVTSELEAKTKPGNADIPEKKTSESPDKKSADVSERRSGESIEKKSGEMSEKKCGESVERRTLRRTQDDRPSGSAPENETRLTRRSLAEGLPEKRATRSNLDQVEGIKPLKQAETDQKAVTRETRRAAETEVKSEESPGARRETRRAADTDMKSEESTGARRTRSLRSDQPDANKKNDLTPSRSPPPKRIKAEDTTKIKSEDEANNKSQPSNKDGVVINVKKKKKKFGEKGKAFLEADVIRRVQELKTQGLWTEKKLPKQYLEARTKTHWDFVLEEMTWLSDVVQKELKIKKANAKKCAAMVQKYFKDKEMASIRAEKMREANLRKIAANMAREVRGFWGNAQKLFEWRVKQKLERKRKEALDQHLQFIVDKTEKYSTLLAESLAETTSGQVSRAESVCSGDTEESPGDGEYAPDSGSSDDEETIEKEETEAKDGVKAEEELADLEAAAEVPIEELLKKYYPDQLQKMREDKEEVKKEEKEEIKKEEGEEKMEEVNDSETTATGRRRRKPINFAEVEKKIKEEDSNTLLGETVEEDEVKVKTEEQEVKKEKEGEDLKSLVEGEDKLEEYANMAAKFQPTGNTLETTTVKTKVPSLLKHTLREYQHIGLDWLVSLYERGLNGILADEMGLGKTIQTIALMAHLAVDRNNWGPHLIVVPTSVMLNWEMEIKKWCPGFKVLVYYGSQKERKMKRVGWTKPNAFHICITSYKLVIQDHSSFRRFKWQYFILDEAQHIKNFKSQRWQLLLNFVSVGRLLLTGTPLQNNLMELWSLMHFLMPHVFESHRDFKEWFSNPMTGMVEGNSEYNDSLIRRLHKVLRPFLLRRLKSEVEKQLPKKYEHLVKCPLSKRQRYLYDDFMSRAKTKETLASGNLLSVINVLMQLRKCCNHPNLFEPRPTLSPFVMDMVDLRLPRLVHNCLDYQVESEIDLRATPLNLLHHELNVEPYTVFRASCLATSNSRMMNPPSASSLPMFSCPTGKMRVEVKSQNPPVPKQDFEHHSPVLPLTLTGLGYVIPAKKLSNRDYWLWKNGHKLKTPSGYFQIAKVAYVDPSITSQIDSESDPCLWSPPKKVAKVDENRLQEQPAANPKEEAKDKDSREACDDEPKRKVARSGVKKSAKGIFSLGLFASEKMTLAARSPNKAKKRRLEAKAREAELVSDEYNSKREAYMLNRRRRNYELNRRRCDLMPMYGADLVECVQEMSLAPSQLVRTRLEQLTCHTRIISRYKEEVTCYSENNMVDTLAASLTRIQPIFDRFLINVPKAWVSSRLEVRLADADARRLDYPGDRLRTKFQVQTPDTRLIQYDCGKLQILSVLLRRLFTEGHRALIFTQMTRMLDVLEAFLNFHGYVYMRLDGATKVETRQALMERFNNNSKYFIFILSTRSGGVGINLTGADTVIFYDSDWNPTMDAQAQDRCHRIGQTRDVHIYRLISERTVEENILKKANQKRILGDLAIEGGNFTTAFFKKQTIHDLFEENANATSDDLAAEENAEAPKKSIGAFENALATAEDDSDRQATKDAKAEENVDEQDFNEQTEEDQFNAVLAELSKVEVYALKHVEWMEEDWVQGQMAAAEAEIEARKEEFDAEKLDELTQEIREEMGDVSSEGGEEEEGGDVEDEGEEGEYSPDESDSDDEETIEKDEKEVDDKNNDNEINMLENEAEVPIEELIKQYYPDHYKQMDLGQVQIVESVPGDVAVEGENTAEEFKILDMVETNDHEGVNQEFHVEAMVDQVTQEMMEQVQSQEIMDQVHSQEIMEQVQSQEMMEHVQEAAGLVAAQVTEEGAQEQGEVVNNHQDGGEEETHHLVNGGDDVHIAVLDHHQEGDEEALQAFAQVLESYQPNSGAANEISEAQNSSNGTSDPNNVVEMDHENVVNEVITNDTDHNNVDPDNDTVASEVVQLLNDIDNVHNEVDAMQSNNVNDTNVMNSNSEMETIEHSDIPNDVSSVQVDHEDVHTDGVNQSVADQNLSATDGDNVTADANRQAEDNQCTEDRSVADRDQAAEVGLSATDGEGCNPDASLVEDSRVEEETENNASEKSDSSLNLEFSES